MRIERCFLRLPLSVFVLLTVAACGGSDNIVTVDASVSGQDGPTASDDAQGEVSCVGKADGTDCGGGAICLKGTCVSSRCGDGYIDKSTNEDCEDGNGMTGDGCSNCRFDCRTDMECDDKNTCNGAETCDKSSAGKQLCKAGMPAAAGTACTTEGGAGMCRNGTCAKAGCGNGAADMGEECDDGNADDTDGCTRLCKFTCKASTDCDDKNACNGTETCDVATHRCRAGTAMTCMGMAGCTGTCEPKTGMCVYPDADKDGKTCDTDCSDADPAVFPTGFECKDGKDNDCNPMTADSTAPGCECYVDTDKDGYAATTTGAVASAGSCPDGYTRRRPENMTSIDCAARLATVNPGQRSYFATAYCPGLLIFNPGSGMAGCSGGTSFDYDCDTKETQFDSSTASATCAGYTNVFLCIFASGWVGTVPACGAKGTYRQCSFANGVCTGTDTPGRTQECR